MKNIFSNISFIGGIHGVGKSTICKDLCNTLNIKYLSASEVLKWEEINQDVKNKQVQDIQLTQNRLIDGLNKRVNKEYHYLLDGHYCLIGKSNKIIKIPIETFQLINPNSLYLIVGNIHEIKSRLQIRDKHIYDYNLLKEIQELEIEHAKKVSKHLNVDLIFGKEGDYANILKGLKKFKIQ